MHKGLFRIVPPSPSTLQMSNSFNVPFRQKRREIIHINCVKQFILGVEFLIDNPLGESLILESRNAGKGGLS